MTDTHATFSDPTTRLPDALVELLAERFRVLSEPIRIRILEQLRGGPRTVQEIVAAVGSSQQNVSKHLGLMRSLGIVSRRKEGSYSLYEIADETVIGMCDQVCGALQRRVAELHTLIETEPS